MQLPNVASAVVPREKIVEYLLNRAHPDGAAKASFFLDAGFQLEHWEVLADALKQLAERAPVARSVDSPHGSKYIIDGEINTPLGRAVSVRSIWIIDRDQVEPRLVTAYPHR